MNRIHFTGGIDSEEPLGKRIMYMKTASFSPK